MAPFRLRALLSGVLILALTFSWFASTFALAEEPPVDVATPEAVIVEETVEPETPAPDPTEVATEPAAEPTAIPEETPDSIELSGPSGTVQFDRDEGFVGDQVNFSVTGFPGSASLQIVHTDPFANQNLVPTLVPVSTDGAGNANGGFLIPPTVGSDLHNFRVAVGFDAGPPPTETFSASPGSFEVKGRLTTTPGVHAIGDSITISLTGGPFPGGVFDLTWLVGQTPTFVTSVNIAAGGHASFNIQVPNFATSGVNTIQLRGFSGTVNVSVAGSNPTVVLSTTRTTVNNRVTFTAFGFDADSIFTVTWRRPGGSTLQMLVSSTDNQGSYSGNFKVPATEGGNGNRIIFQGGAATRTLTFNVAPRIKLIPGTGVRGGSVEVSLRGYSKGETVRIRWKIGTSFVQIRTVTMSNTGSANVTITIPANAPIGANSVRGDGTVWRQQTNAFVVLS